MAETTANPPTADTSQASPNAQPTTPIWDKFKTVEDRDKSFGEAFTAVTGQKWKGKLDIGPAGDYPDENAAREAYKKLERAFHATRKPEQPKPSEPANTNAPIQIGGQKPEYADLDAPYDVGKLLEDSGLKMEDIEAHWREHGDLSDDQYAKIRAQRKNLGKADIKLLAAGLAAAREVENSRTTARNSKIVEMFGGQEKARTILDWAKGLPAERQSAIDDLLKSDKHYEFGVRAIVDEYTKANGQPSSPTRGGTSSATGPITTPQEFQEAFRLAMKGDAAAIKRIKDAPTSVVGHH